MMEFVAFGQHDPEGACPALPGFFVRCSAEFDSRVQARGSSAPAAAVLGRPVAVFYALVGVSLSALRLESQFSSASLALCSLPPLSPGALLTVLSFGDNPLRRSRAATASRFFPNAFDANLQRQTERGSLHFCWPGPI